MAPQRELRPRADGAVHARGGPRGLTEQDIREVARSWGWTAAGDDSTTITSAPTSSTKHGPGQRPSSAGRDAGLGRTSPGSSSSTRRTRRSSSRSSGATSSRPPPDAETRRAQTLSIRLPGPAGAGGDPAHPRSTRVPPSSSPRPSLWPGCCAPASTDSDQRQTWYAGQQLYQPPDVGGWDDTAGSTRTRSSRAGRPCTRSWWPPGSPAPTTSYETAVEARRRGGRVLGRPRRSRSGAYPLDVRAQLVLAAPAVARA